MNFSSDALRDIDWDENMPLPVANAENKLLDETIQKKLFERNRLTKDLAENQSKTNALREHIKYVKDELISAQVMKANKRKFFVLFILLNRFQSLLQARKNELKTEDHLRSIAERENGRLVQENQRLISQLEKLKETRNAHEVKLSSKFYDYNLRLMLLIYLFIE